MLYYKHGNMETRDGLWIVLGFSLFSRIYSQTPAEHVHYLVLVLLVKFLLQGCNVGNKYLYHRVAKLGCHVRYTGIPATSENFGRGHGLD